MSDRMDDINEMLDTKDLFSEKESSGLSPSELENSLAGRLEDGRIRNSLKTFTARKSNAHRFMFRKKKREMNTITSTSTKHLQKQEIGPLDDFKYSPIVDETKSHTDGTKSPVGGSSLHETPGHMFVTSDLVEALESCLSTLLHSTKGFRISMALNDGEIITPVILDVYRPNSHSSLEPYSVTKHLLGNDKIRPETQPSVSTNTITPLYEDVLTMNRQALTTVALGPDIGFMGKAHMRDIECWEPHYNLLGKASIIGKAPRTIVGDKPKQVEGSSDSFTTRHGGLRAEFDTKRKELEDDPLLCSASSSDRSDRSDDSDDSDDSESEDDNVPVWASSRSKAPYDNRLTTFIRGFGSNTSYLPCSDSPESGSGTGGSAAQNTPASSAPSLPGGNSLLGIGQPPLGAGLGSSNQRHAPLLGDISAREENSTPSQPLSLVCWYAAAGIACLSRKIKKDPKTRRLWL